MATVRFLLKNRVPRAFCRCADQRHPHNRPPPRANQENRYFCALVPFTSPLENGERANVERIANLNIGTLCAMQSWRLIWGG